MSIVFKIRQTSGLEAALLVGEGSREWAVSTVDDVRTLIAETTARLTVVQHHGLGLFAAVLAFHEYAGRFRPSEMGKVLDSVYFPTGSREAGQAFSRGLGEGLFDLRRAVDLGSAAAEVIGRAASDLRGAASSAS